jgi:hypothetical protein
MASITDSTSPGAVRERKEKEREGERRRGEEERRRGGE